MIRPQIAYEQLCTFPRSDNPICTYILRCPL